MTTAIIDGDTLAWLAALRAESTADFGSTGIARVADMDTAKAEVRSQVEAIRDHTKADAIVMTLSCPTRVYWRMKIWPTYKQHRAGGVKPVALGKVKEWMATKSNCYVRPQLEADDVVGILATSKKIPGKKIIVSSDKDLKQIPGTHFNPNFPEGGLFEVTPEEGRRWHLMQTLMGDQVDGFPGCPGVGPKKAEAALKQGTWAEVVAVFDAKKLTEEDALVQARVARILTHSDWDYKKKERKLWQPPRPSGK